MRPTDAYDTFEQAYRFPVDRETVIEELGDTEIESPSGDDETIAETLERTDTEQFRSARELNHTFMSNLSDRYIGRKYYDDRGDNPGDARERERERGS